MSTSTSEPHERAEGSPLVVDAVVDRPSRPGPPDGDAGLWHRVHGQITRRHALVIEVIAMVVLYAVYDSGRGLVVGGAKRAFRNAHTIARFEKHLHIFIEPHVQATLTRVPGLVGLFTIGYDTFHLGVTGAVLIWLYFFRPHVFPRIRTLLIVTSLLALVGFSLFPTAPPRLAGLGIKDTLHLGRATAESGVLHWLYNPYAAVPSLHMAFAVIAGGSIFLFARHRWTRVVGGIYPLFIAAEVISTGNHFLFDVVTGVLVVVVALVITIPLASEGADRRIGHTVRLIGARGGDLFRP